MKLSDILILAGLALIAGAAIHAIIVRKKKGGCMGCSNCPMAGNCQKEKQANE